MIDNGKKDFSDEALDFLIRGSKRPVPLPPDGHHLHTLAAFRRRTSPFSLRSSMAVLTALMALAACASFFVLKGRFDNTSKNIIPDQTLSVMFEFDDEETELFQEWHELGDSVLASNAQSVRGVSD